MLTGIYKITSPSGNIYIGSAINIERRWIRHRKDMRSGKHGNRKIQRAVSKYGIEALRFEILLICSTENLLMYEQRALDVLKPRYNIAPVAGNSVGIKRSAEFRAKVSAGLRGRIVSAETRAKIGARHKGKKITPANLKAMRDGLAAKPTPVETLRANAARTQTPEIQAKRTAALIGRQVSAETKEKISNTLKGRPHSAERIAAIMAGKMRNSAITLQNGS
jgi:group I intron endonuclease